MQKISCETIVKVDVNSIFVLQTINNNQNLSSEKNIKHRVLLLTTIVQSNPQCLHNNCTKKKIMQDNV